MKRIFIVVLMSLMLISTNGCSSMKTQNAVCDFVQGGHDSAKEREARQELSSSKSKDVQEGFLSAFWGYIFRPNNEECQLEPYIS